MIRSSLIFLMIAGAQASSLPALMPMPPHVTAGAGHLPIDSSFRIASAGFSDARLDAAATRLTARLFRKTGMARIGPVRANATLTIECRKIGSGIPALGEDESYELEVTPDAARLKSESVTGAMRGMETFIQLVIPGPDGFQVPVVTIQDRPRFPWRGLMLDVSRHFMPVEVVKRNLDGMAAVKLNVFHWHLADDQGFRVESRVFPKLQGAGSDGQFYTQEQIREVVAYAAGRRIRVVPEFDVPGHTSSWLAGYPELASAPGPYEIQRRWGIFEPVLDPTREETYRFLDAFIAEMAGLFPDPYFHIGGDEVEDAHWKQSAAIQAFAKAHQLADSRGLHAYFNRRVQELLRKHGKVMMGCDEVLAPGMAEDTIIQSWRGQQSLAEASRQGYRGVLSFGYYLDHLKPASFHYAVDPLAGTGLDAEHAARILGGEACMWVEYVSPETVDSRIWPRLAAIAERLWSPKDVTDVNSMYRRMEAVSRELTWVGLRHRTNYQPMLERLAGAEPAEPLRVLADACEALGIEGRRDARRYTSLVDLNRFVDAVRPESETVRHLEQAAAKAALESAELRFHLRAWAENNTRLEPLAEGNTRVAELLPLSGNLAAVGAIGLEALEVLRGGKTAGRDWIAARRHTLDELGKPMAEVSLAAVRPVRILLDAISRESVATGAHDARGR